MILSQMALTQVTIYPQMSRQTCSHTPSAPNAGAKWSDVTYGLASMWLLCEESEATEPYNKYANLFKGGCK